MKDYTMMEPALEFLAPYGPDLRNGLTSHAPMAVEALAALGRADAVMPWLEAYSRGMEPRPVAHQQIGREDWRAALGRTDRAADRLERVAPGASARSDRQGTRRPARAAEVQRDHRFVARGAR